MTPTDDSPTCIARKRINWDGKNDIEAYIPDNNEDYAEIHKHTTFTDGVMPIDTLITSDIQRDGVSDPVKNRFRMFSHVKADRVACKHLIFDYVQSTYGVHLRHSGFDDIIANHVCGVRDAFDIFDCTVNNVINLYKVNADIRITKTTCDTLRVKSHNNSLFLGGGCHMRMLSLIDVDTSRSHGTLTGSIPNVVMTDCNLTKCFMRWFKPKSFACTRTIGDGTYIKNVSLGPILVTYTSDHVWIADRTIEEGGFIGSTYDFDLARIDDPEVMSTIMTLQLGSVLTVWDYILDHPAKPFGTE